MTWAGHVNPVTDSTDSRHSRVTASRMRDTIQGGNYPPVFVQQLVRRLSRRQLRLQHSVEKLLSAENFHSWTELRRSITRDDWSERLEAELGRCVKVIYTNDSCLGFAMSIRLMELLPKLWWGTEATVRKYLSIKKFFDALNLFQEWFNRTENPSTRKMKLPFKMCVPKQKKFIYRM